MHTMRTITQQVVSELDVLYGLYQLALEQTQKIEPEEESEMVKWLDTRQRILSRTEETSNRASQLLKRFQVAKNIPANEKALVQEKKQWLQETFHQMQLAEYDLFRNMNQRMKKIRSQLAQITIKKNAAKAYVLSPKPRVPILH